MNPISWNYRGLGNPWSVKALHDLVQRWNPKIVFLMETKSRKNRVERIKNRIGFANGLIVPIVGRSGGILFSGQGKLIWRLKATQDSTLT